MGIKALRKIQLGRESTAGTAVAATSIWRGLGGVDDQTEVVFPEEDIGVLSGTDRSYIAKKLAKVVFDAVPATFEQLLHILEAGVKTIGTGVADGSGTDKIYDYTFPISSANTIKTYTLEGGDDAGAEEVEYAFVEEFTLAGKAGEAWTMAASWLGRQSTPASFTAALTVPTVEEILFGKTLLYIDPVTAAFGTTIKSNTLIEASLKVKTGWQAVFTGDGNLYFSFAKCTMPEFLLEITFEHDATAVAEKAAWRAQTSRAIQLKATGSAVATPGTTYTYKMMILNIAGKWEKFDVIGEQDGNDIVKGTLRGRYNATNSKLGNIIVVNELASVP